MVSFVSMLIKLCKEIDNKSTWYSAFLLSDLLSFNINPNLFLSLLQEMKKLERPKRPKNAYALFVSENFRKGGNSQVQLFIIFK